MGRKSSTNVLSRFLSQPAEYGVKEAYDRLKMLIYKLS